MAQVETKLGRVQAVAGEGVVDSSVKAQQLQAGLSQLSTSLANFGKASEKRRIQNDIITARTAFALNQEMPGSLAPEAEIAFNDMVAVKSTNQFFRLLSDDAEVFGNQVLIDDEVYPDHNTKQAAFEDFIDGSKKTFFDQAQFNDAQQSSILASVVEKVGKLKDSFSILAAKDIKALKLNETVTFVQESIINVVDSFKQSIETASSLGDDKVGKDSSFSGGEMSGMLEGSEGMGAFSKYQRKPKFDRTWHEDLKKTIAKANPNLIQDELDDLIIDQIGLLATDPDDPHPEYLEYFTEPGKRGKPSLSIIPNLSKKARSLYVTARSNFIAHQKATSAAEVKYEKEQEQLAYDKAQSYIVEEVGNIDGGQRDLLKLHANVRKLFPKISPTHLKAVINYANTLITASANEGDPKLTLRLSQLASIGGLTLDHLNNTDIAKTLTKGELVKVTEQILRYSQGQVTDKRDNLNKESASLRSLLMTALETKQTLKFGGATYKLGQGEKIRFNIRTNRIEGVSPLNMFGVDSIVNSFLDRADHILTDPNNVTPSDVRRELSKLKTQIETDVGILINQNVGDIQEGKIGSLVTDEDRFNQAVKSEGKTPSDLQVFVSTSVPESYNPEVHLPPNKQLTMGQVLQKDFKDKNTAIKDAVLGSLKATEPNTPKTEAPKTETPRSTLSIPEQQKAAFDKAAPDVPNERNDLRSLQDDAKFQSDRTIMDVISDLVSPGKAEGVAVGQDPNFNAADDVIRNDEGEVARGFDENNNPIFGTRNELAKGVGELALSKDFTSTVSADSSRINDPKFQGGTSDESDIDTSDSNDATPPLKKVEISPFEKALATEELGDSDAKALKGKPYISSTLAGQLNLKGKSRTVTSVEDVPNNSDMREVTRDKTGITIGKGHDVTPKELSSGTIHGIPFVGDNGKFIELDENALNVIFKKDVEKARQGAEKEFNGYTDPNDGTFVSKNLSIRFKNLPKELQDYLTERHFNTGFDKSPKADIAFRKALALSDKRNSGLIIDEKELIKQIKTYIKEISERPGVQDRANKMFKASKATLALFKFFN